MNTAERINAEAGSVLEARNEARELAVGTDAPDCVTRIYTFHDGSKLEFGRTGGMTVLTVVK